MKEESKSPITYVTVFQASEKWKIHQAKIIKLCEDGKIEGAAKLEDKWIIPSDSEKPIIPTSTTLARPVIAKNKIQETVIDNVEKGHNFHTREIVVDGKTFIVSSIFQKQGATPEEKMAGHIVRRMEEFEGLKLSAKDYDELIKEIRAISSANSNTFEKYIEHYKTLFQQYGFSSEDVEVLLERKSLDYEEFRL